MSGETYEIGEVAILSAADPRINGTEVTVTGQLQWKRMRGRVSREIYEGPAYPISGPGLIEGRSWAPPYQLRKRRPPQDWIQLCRLAERPVEEPA